MKPDTRRRGRVRCAVTQAQRKTSSQRGGGSWRIYLARPSLRQPNCLKIPDAHLTPTRSRRPRDELWDENPVECSVSPFRTRLEREMTQPAWENNPSARFNTCFPEMRTFR